MAVRKSTHESFFLFLALSSSLFKNEAELRELWSSPITRKTLLEKLKAAGYDTAELNALRKLVAAKIATYLMFWNVFLTAIVSL
ncbi:MAG: hypothetical protein ACI87N_002352 [Flavobacteriales bacterium]|jgi:hypothetical protein